DSSCTVHLLSEEGHQDHQHAEIARKYRQILERDWRVTMKHVYRETNHLADELANKGHNLGFSTHLVESTFKRVIY
ncbi:hypothetical protein LINPERPRIM_LOCUS22595, partial [Linum perenne]